MTVYQSIMSSYTLVNEYVLINFRLTFNQFFFNRNSGLYLIRPRILSITLRRTGSRRVIFRH